MADKIIAKLESELKSLKILKTEKAAVALSGGADSLFLTIALHNLGYKIIAIIVDHKLRPTSTSEAQLVKQKMTDLNIKAVLLTWNHDPLTSGIEEQAREARYNLLYEFCRSNNINTIFTGHHADDQIETFFLNLVRGSGLNGLSSMPGVTQKDNIRLVRPMLKIHKEEMVNWLKYQQITWIEDESNSSDLFKRNKLRRLLNEIDDKEIINSRILGCISRLQDDRLIIEKHMQDLALSMIEVNNSLYTLSRERFVGLLAGEKSYLLRYVLQTVNISSSKRMPRFDELQSLLEAIEKEEKGKKTLFNCIIKWNPALITISQEKTLDISV